MAKTIRVSEAYHEVLKAHNREGETMEETLRRLTGGPDPEVIAEVIADGETDSEDLRAAIERKRERGRERRASLRERFE
jgi:predicted CopG family antitoxin